MWCPGIRLYLGEVEFCFQSLSGGNVWTNTLTINPGRAHRNAAVCGVFRVLLPSPLIVAFVHREWDGASILLPRGFVRSLSSLHPCSSRFLIRTSWTASVEPANQHPAVFITPEPSTAVFRVWCGTVISQSSHLSRLSVCLLFLLAPFNTDPASPCQRALSGLPKTISQLELQSSSFALTRLFGIDS